MSDDGGNTSDILHGSAKSSNSRKVARRRKFLVAPNVVGGRARVDDITDWLRRRRRTDDGIDIWAGPTPDPRTVRTGTFVRGSLRRHVAGKLVDGCEDFVGHRRGARIHH